jgi:hypothetical protein
LTFVRIGPQRLRFAMPEREAASVRAGQAVRLAEKARSRVRVNIGLTTFESDVRAAAFEAPVRQFSGVGRHAGPRVPHRP